MNSNLINRVINETASKEDAEKVVEWFSTSIEGQQHLSDMLDKDAYLMDNDIDTGKSFSPTQSDVLFRKIDREIRKKQFTKISLKVAAVLLPLIILVASFIYFESGNTLFNKIEYAELYIPKGENARIFFQDGTEVFLNSDTKIRYPQRFGLGERVVHLDGEAYFNVSPTKKKSFTVYAQNTSVEVTGTAFNVNAYSNNEIIEVVLDEGKTSFHVDKNSYSMDPGQQIEYNKTTGKTTLYNLSKSSNSSLWRNNILFFYDTPLDEVIKILERKYDVQFHLQSSEALNYSYTLTTKQNDIESVLGELQKIAPVKFSYNDHKVFVSVD